MAMMNNKKGFFFTIIALIIVSLLFMIFMGRGDVAQRTIAPVEESRIKVVNNYVRSAEDIYIKRMLVASSYKAIDEVIGYAKNLGEAPDDLNWFSNLMIDGKLNNINIMGEHSLSDKLELLENVTFEMLHLNASFKPIEAKLFQNEATGPWRLGVNLSVAVFVDGIIAQWNSTTIIEALIDIEGMNDPLIRYNTDKDKWPISKTEFGSNWTGNNTFVHLIEKTYKHEPRAPSFINRLMNLTPESECCGIESLIDFSSLGLKVKNVSSVDYCYWKEFGCIEEGYGQFLWEVDNITDAGVPYFRLDSYHSIQYNTTNKDKCEFNDTGYQEWTGNGCIEVAALPHCGDGNVDFLSEDCDDYGNEDGDGCDSNCEVEDGWICDYDEPSDCEEDCGDSIVIGDEECDDGNTDDGDGCNWMCEIEGSSTCGDAIVDPGEDCEGNDLNGETCVSQGYASGILACTAGCDFDTSGCVAGGGGPPAHCSDIPWNVNESDLNCGGNCVSCSPGFSCWTSKDCANACDMTGAIPLPPQPPDTIIDPNTGQPYTINGLRELAGQAWIIKYQGTCI
ncbi:hypothetical protein ACFLYT_02015 [Nanoarchaeota archaeon]